MVFLQRMEGTTGIQQEIIEGIQDSSSSSSNNQNSGDVLSINYDFLQFYNVRLLFQLLIHG